MSEPAERFALARRGLPLAAASQATLKGAWLPAAARNRRAPEPTRTTVTVAPAAADLPATDDEPWWMEASELVPQTAPVSATGNASPHTIERAPDASPRAAQPEALASTVADRPHQTPAEPAPRDRETNDRVAAQPTGERARRATDAPPEIITTPMRAVAASSSIRTTARESEQPPAHAIRAAIEPHVDRNRDDHAALRPATAPAPNVSVAVLGAVESTSHVEPAPMSRRAAPPAARAQFMPPRAVDSTKFERPTERVRSETSEPALATMGRVRVEIMGASSPAATSSTPATADLSSLLAPVKGNAGEIRIDRVAVTVQSAGTRQTQSAPAALPAVPAAALPARAYRNPWASYFARRD